MVIDALGKKCPMPILILKKNLKKVEVGQIVELIGDDIGSKKDVPAFCKKMGHELLRTWEEGNSVLHFFIKKGK